jgi:hypothetical protein
MRRLVGPALLLMVPRAVFVRAQNRMNFPLVSQDTGPVALGLALRKLNVSGTFMQTAAHPDDEHNALYAMFTHGMGLRSIDAQTTRGDVGQNEIGPELFQDMAVLRNSELLSAHRLDGAERYFTRAIAYGYSFDPEEVIKKCRDETCESAGRSRPRSPLGPKHRPQSVATQSRQRVETRGAPRRQIRRRQHRGGDEECG